MLEDELNSVFDEIDEDNDGVGEPEYDEKGIVSCYVYKIDIIPTKELYIGSSFRGNRDSYWGSGRIMKERLAQYGKENMRKTLIAEYTGTQFSEVHELAENKENELINRYKELCGERCINIRRASKCTFTEEWFKNREDNKWKYQTDEFKEKIGNATKKRWEDDIYKISTSNNIKKAVNSNEVKKIISISSIKRWNDPYYKKQTSDKIKNSWNDKNRRMKASIHTSKVMSNPNLRESISTKVKKIWNDPAYYEWLTNRVSTHIKNIKCKLTPQELKDYQEHGIIPDRVQKKIDKMNREKHQN